MKLASIHLTMSLRSSRPLTEISIFKLNRDSTDADFLSVDRASVLVYPGSTVDIPASIISDPSTPWGMPLGVYREDINELNQLPVASTLAIHLNNVELSCADKLLVYDNDLIIKEYLGSDFHAMGMRWLRKSWRMGKLTLTREKAFSGECVNHDMAIDFSTESGDTNVYHWIARALPKLKLVRTLPSNIPLVFSYQPNSFQKECLQFFGIKNPLLILDCNKIAKFKSLVLIEGPWAVGNLPQTDWLVQEALSRLPAVSAQSGSPPKARRIFIYRDKAARRRMVNQSQVMQFLENQGFQPYAIEEFSFAECVALFNGADEIVFEHGASGIWMMFAKPGAKVLEILPERNHSSSNELSNYYFWLGCFAKTQFAYLVCKNQKTDPWAEYAVDMTALRDKLGELGISTT